MDEIVTMTGGYTTGKIDIMKIIYIDIRERNLLATCGYYSKVKHVLDRYDKENKYLIGSEVFPNMIILYYWPFDAFDIYSNCDVVHLYKGDK